MNWFSGKVKVWALASLLMSSTPSSVTSTMCSRGWYLWSDCKTIICIKKKKKGEINALLYEFWNRLNKSVCIFHTKNKNMGPSGLNYIKAAGITFDCRICFHHSQKRENKYIKSSENSVKLFVLQDVEPVCCCCWPLYCWSASACRKRFPASSSEHRCWEIRGGRTFCYLKNWKITESISRQEK